MLNMSLCILNNRESLPKDGQFIADVERRVAQTIQEFDLMDKEETILVAVSGGKDSTVLLHILKKLGYDVEAITIDAHIGCYTKENLEKVTKFCNDCNVKLHVFSFREEYGHSLCDMTKILKKNNKPLGSCTVCGVLRRRILNQAARKVGWKKIATGHNMNDEAQTIFMNIMKSKMNQNARLGPNPEGIGDGFVQRIKPLYFISEEDIAMYSKMHAFPVNYGKCPCSLSSTRNNLKDFLTPEMNKNILAWFKKVLPKLQKKYKGTGRVGECTACGEPSSRKICRACDIVSSVTA